MLIHQSFPQRSSETSSCIYGYRDLQPDHVQSVRDLGTFSPKGNDSTSPSTQTGPFTDSGVGSQKVPETLLFPSLSFIALATLSIFIDAGT